MPRRNQMEIEITGDLKDINRALGRLDKNVKTTGKNIEKNVNRGFDRMRTKTEGLQRSLGVIRNKLLLLTFAFAGTLLTMKKIVATSAEFEFLETRLTSLFGSVEEGAKAFDMFNKFSAKTPFVVKDVVEAGATLQAFLGSEADSRTLIGSIGDLAAYMGLTIPEAASAFGRAFSAGAGAADILRERGILQLVKSFKGIEDVTKLTLPEFRKALIETLQDPMAGIAGSTERLSKTWIGAVSNMQDAIARMFDAIGDRIIPVLRPFLGYIIDIAGAIQDFIKIPVTEELHNQRVEYNALVDVLRDVNTGQSTRNQIIKDLQTNYGEYIGNIKLETASIEQLAQMQRLANIEFEKKIRLAASEEILQEAFEKSSKAAVELAEAEVLLAKMKRKTQDDFPEQIRQYYNHNVALEAQEKNVKKLREESEKLQTAYTDLYTILIELGYQLDINTGEIIEATYGYAAAISDPRFLDATEMFKGINKVLKKGEEALYGWVLAQKQVVTGGETIDESIKVMLKGLAPIVSLTNQFSSALAQAVIYGQKLGPAVVSSLKAIAAQLLAKAAAFSILNLLSGGTFGIGTTIMQYALGIPRFQHGGEFIARQPQIIMVGEKGDEHVKITPTSGGGVSSQATVQIMGGLIDDSYLRNTFIPALNRVLSSGGVKIVG